ncbi:MAG: Zn-ribbon domain-containing OB-fold protein [Acidimicrobiia bacterium]|nr:Zn-ribbon domain-containing OB-fold protein [Acidimicrobiia bacterium]
MADSPSTAYARPRPFVTTLNKPHWDALREHRLSMQRCDDCGHVRFPPGPWCTECHSRASTWTDLSGRATLNSFVVFHRAYFAAFDDAVPYNVAEVTLAEGPRLLADVVGVANEALRGGMDLEVVYDDVADDLTLARFRPVGGP